MSIAKVEDLKKCELSCCNKEMKADVTRYENNINTSISDSQKEYLKMLVKERGVSITEYLREVVIQHLHDQEYMEED